MGFLDDLRGKSGKTDLLEKEDLSPTDEGDHERFAHYVDKNKITESAVTGNLCALYVARSGYLIVIRKNSQYVQHVKRFTPA